LSPEGPGEVLGMTKGVFLERRSYDIDVQYRRMSSISYATCPCTGVYQLRFVEVRMKVNDRSGVLTEVPQGACPNCGSRVYKAEVPELKKTS
jgi:hypothetical protein